MQNSKLKAGLIGTLAVAAQLLVVSLPQAQTVAGRGPVVRLNSEGFRICRNFQDSGRQYWEGKVRGAMSGSSSRNRNTGFSVRTCFATEAQCSNFVNRIESRIFPIEFIKFAGCKPKG